MSDERISIGELEAKRAAMTGGNWSIECDKNDQLNIYANDTDWIALFPHQCVRSIEEQQERNAVGLLAEHNAMPVLIEVVKAALAWSEQRHQNLRDAVMRSEEEIEAESVETRRARMKRTAGLAMAIERALSKVQP